MCLPKRRGMRAESNSTCLPSEVRRRTTLHCSEGVDRNLIWINRRCSENALSLVSAMRLFISDEVGEWTVTKLLQEKA
jgi:hypothetical protein